MSMFTLRNICILYDSDRGSSFARFRFATRNLVSMFSSYTWVSYFKKVHLRFVFSKSVSFSKTFSTDLSLKMYQTIERGSMYTENYRIYFRNEDGPISPFHDIPVYRDVSKKLVNMIVEIPRWTNAKMEINLKEPLNPIKQDVKKGKVRFVANCFPHHGYIWNYGAIPQTWENPFHLDDSTGYKGDNDPVDVVEIGYKVAKRGQVIAVKVLGCFALIDEEETDWKIIAIDHEDPIAGQVNDLQDVEKFFPGLLKATVEWFKIYKIPDGKPENKFAFNGEARNKEFATNVIDQTHKFWKALVKKEVECGAICCNNVTNEDSPYKISSSEAQEIVNNSPEQGPPAEIGTATDKWHFVKLPNEDISL